MKHKIFLSCFVAAGAFVSPFFVHAAPLDIKPSASAVYQPVAANTDVVAQGAEKFITKLADQGIGFLGDKTISQEKQSTEFRKLLNKNFDMNTIARFSLGRHWRTATKSERGEYMKLFKAMIIDVYSERFSDYQGQ